MQPIHITFYAGHWFYQL